MLDFYKKNESDVIWLADDPENVGEFKFSFDKKKIFFLYKDYPHALTPAQKATFDHENPEWADYFKDRK